MRASAFRTYAAIAAASAVYFFPFVRVLWRVGDEGTLVYGAVRVVNGQVPYRDFFEVMGPGSFYWLACAFKAFGTSWWTSRAALLATFISTVVLLYHLGCRIRRNNPDPLPAFLYAAVSLPLWPAVNHHWDSNLFALASFAVFLAWIDLRRPAILAAAGVLSGLTTCFIQQKGALLLVSYVFVICWVVRDLRLASRLAGVLVASYAAVIAALIGYFAVVHGAGQLWYANAVFPLSQYGAVNHVPYAHGLRELHFATFASVSTQVFGDICGAAIAFILATPLCVIAALPVLGVAILLWNRKALEQRALAYWVSGCALWISELHRPDIMHLVYGSPILALAVWDGCRSIRTRLAVVTRHVVVATTALFAVYNLLIACTAGREIETRRGTVRAHGSDAALEFVVRNVKTAEPLFVYPYYPMYYFLADVENPTPFSILMYHINTPAQFRQAIDRLEATRTRYVLWDTFVAGKNLTRWFPAYEEPPEGQLVMERYLSEHYKVMGVANGFRLLERTHDPKNGIAQAQ